MKRRISLLSVLALLVGLLPLTVALPALAEEGEGDIVISQVYGGGGNSGATYTNDFVELFNRGDAPVDVTGWSVQYASASGSSWQVTTLSGVIQPGQYYLVQESAGAGGTTPLPDPDASGNIAMSATAGKVALVASTTALTGTCPTGVVDFVGFGTTANCFEGSGPTGTLSNTTAAIRAGDGCVDTDHNASDFEIGSPAPRNTASDLNPCDGGGDDGEPEPEPPAHLVISQVYGGGGNSGAVYRQDFIEIFNPTGEAVSLQGWSVQYASAAGTSWQVTPLTGTIQPGGYVLVGQAFGTGGTQDLPAPDITGSIAMSATAGKVALVDSTAALSGACPAGVVDFVGFGATANCYEGSGPTPAPSNTNAVLRAGGGCVDTDDNASDFTAGLPEPRNSASPANDCEGGDDGDPEPPVGTCPEPPEVSPIGLVQGPGDVSPCVGEMVVIEGVVVGDYEGPAPNLRGFYVQSPDGAHDDDPATSEGIFVFHGDEDTVDLGDLVRVTGVVAEFQGQTQLNFPESVEVISSGHTVTPAMVTMPFPTADYLERYEGMLVAFEQTLYVTEFFQLGRFGQVVVSSGDRLWQPAAVVEPGPGAAAMQEANNLNRLIIDDHLNDQNPDPILLGRGGNPLSAANTLRGGDTVTGAVGVMTYTWAGNSASGNAYRLRVVGDLSDSGLVEGGVVPEFVPANPRPADRPEVGGNVTVAAFNVLNYFLTLNTSSSVRCGPAGFEQECRGANSSDEFTRQRAKLLQALSKLDVDVLGLMELENTPGVEPVADLVAGLNAIAGAGAYDYIDTGVIGTDVIRVGLIYRTGVVEPVGDFAIIDSSVDPRFDDDLNRPSLAQSFRHVSTGEAFTVVVNHLKSKGSCPASGPDADQGDGQGCWAAARTRAAQAIVDWLYTYPTGVVDDDFLIVGDLNSYGKEDPIRVFLDAGFVDLHAHFGDDYGYVFDGQWGYLDHALASPSLFAQVTGAASYHINADEPSVLDYNVEFKSAGQLVSLYAPDEFRTSDHDPVVVGIQFAASLPAWSPTEVYDTGDRVMYDGRVWEALWWTRGQAPGDPYGPWMEIATAPDGTAIWTPSRIFDTGDRVIYDGKVWEALWWTRNQKPGDPYGPWQEIAEMPDGTAIWTPSRVFEAGDLAWHEGKLYQAQWWNRNTRPTGKGAWKQIG